MKSHWFNAAVVVIYAVFSVVLTYPLVAHMNDMVPGFYDVWDHVWNLWWVKKSILELNANPYYSGYIFHPGGADLALHELAFVDGLMALPFKSPVFAYNMLCLISFVLGGFGMYLLARYVTGDPKSSFFAGLVYAFAPYHFFELNVGHLNLLTIQWIPFYVLYLLKTVREKGLRNSFFCAFFLVLVSLSTWQYALYSVLFALLYLFYLYLNDRRLLYDSASKLCVTALCYMVLASPFLANAAVSMMSRDYSARRSPFTVTYYSSDAAGIFLPNPLHPLYGDYAGGLFRNAVDGRVYDAAVSIGYVTMALAAYYVARREGVFSWIRGRVSSVRFTPRVRKFVFFILALNAVFLYLAFGLDLAAWLVWTVALVSAVVFCYMVWERRAGFWLFSALSFWVLSMGPVLQFMGRMYFPLPYLFLMLVPMVRAPYRAVVFFNLSAALLAAMGLSELNRRLNRGILLTVVASSILLFEFLSVPVFLSDASVPEFYRSLRGEEGDFAVLEVQVSPLTVLYDNEKGTYYVSHDMMDYMHYQTVHGKRMVGGFVSCMYGDLTDFLDNTPVFRQLRHPGSQDILRQDVSALADGILSHYNIRYVIAHEDTIRLLDSVQENASGMIHETLGQMFTDNEVAYNDSTMQAIKVDKETVPLFMRLGRGWYQPSNGSRWMEDEAELVVVSSGYLETELCFEAKGVVDAVLDAGGVSFNLSGSYSSNTLRVRLEEGENKVVFRSHGGCLLDEPCRSFNFRLISPGACDAEKQGLIVG